MTRKYDMIQAGVFLLNLESFSKANCWANVLIFAGIIIIAFWFYFYGSKMRQTAIQINPLNVVFDIPTLWYILDKSSKSLLN